MGGPSLTGPPSSVANPCRYTALSLLLLARSSAAPLPSARPSLPSSARLPALWPDPHIATTWESQQLWRHGRTVPSRGRLRRHRCGVSSEGCYGWISCTCVEEEDGRERPASGGWRGRPDVKKAANNWSTRWTVRAARSRTEPERSAGTCRSGRRWCYGAGYRQISLQQEQGQLGYFHDSVYGGCLVLRQCGAADWRLLRVQAGSVP
jgi:hypothetical protein